MAISNFVPGSSADDFINVAAFPGFAPFNHQIQQNQPSPPTTSEGSPDSSAQPASGLSFDNDDDEDDDEGLEDGVSKRRNSTAGNGSKRSKASSAERRATHNAIERARRESLNGRFLELAGALPTMANVKRPSKSVIVNKSLEWIYDSQIREHALVRENNALRAELNELRSRMSMPPLPPPPALTNLDYARFKAQNGSAPNSASTLGLHSLQTPGASESYFGTNLSAPLTAIHPMQYPGFGHNGIPAPPPSAPANMLTFSNHFQRGFPSGFVDTPAGQRAASPTAKSEGAESGGLERNGSTIPGTENGSANTTTPGSVFGGSSGSPSSFTDGPSSVGATSADITALHVAHQQHLMAMGMQMGCAPTTNVTSMPWSYGTPTYPIF